MFLDEITTAGAIPTLELTMRFAGQRQRILAHNVANLSTPDFRPMDASPQAFQRTLRRAVEERRERTGGENGEVGWKETRELRRGPDGGLRVMPRTASGNILFHDRNNRDLERTMQDLAENAAAFRVASDLLRSRYDLIRSALAERV